MIKVTSLVPCKRAFYCRSVRNGCKIELFIYVFHPAEKLQAQVQVTAANSGLQGISQARRTPGPRSATCRCFNRAMLVKSIGLDLLCSQVFLSSRPSGPTVSSIVSTQPSFRSEAQPWRTVKGTIAIPHFRFLSSKALTLVVYLYH